MKPAPFDYMAATSADEAVAALAQHGDEAKLLAGGQSLVPMLNLRLARPAVIVDINPLKELDYLREADGRLHVGALRRQRAVERWAGERLPLLAAALRHVGHVAIRNRGTVVGSVAHADPASELPALLLCLDGEVVARGPKGERVIPGAALYRAPLTTSLAADELVTEARFTLPRPDAGWGFAEVARRHGDFALVGSAALLWLDGGGRGRARGGGGPPPPPRHPGGDLADRARAEHRAHPLRRPRRRRDARARKRHPCLRALPAGRGRGARRADADGRGQARPEGAMTREIRLRVNGQERSAVVEPRTSLADCLRDALDLTGTHVGCEHGVCGACTVLLDGEPVRSCLLLAVQAVGHGLTTVEGLAPGDGLSPLQQAFQDTHGLQCGYCTPGILLTTHAFLREHLAPTHEEIREMLAGNLCRCTGYHFIVEAVEAAARAVAGHKPA
jgi:carbon-monoxide dehydrogenase medium subunit